MTATHTSDVNRVLLRAWRFLQKPWNEKANRWNRLLPNIPFPIRLPSGALWLLRKDNLGEPLLAGTFESAELAFVERFLRPGMTMLDLGAHHGLYTLLASKRVGSRGKVIAFEPSPRERRALLLHLILNRCTNAKVQGLAVGNENTDGTLFVVTGSQTGCNSLRPPDVLSGTFPARVRVVRIDDWLDKQRVGQIDFIKLDVEGAELEALKGASRLLERKPRPVILAEVQDVRTIPWGYRAKEILLHLHEKGFRWFKPLSDGSLMRMPDDSAEYEGNFIAVPAERMDQVTEAWAQPYETLRKKWVEVPITALGPYMKTTDLLNLPDDQLLEQWEEARVDITTGPEWEHRGWYHTLYADWMRGKKVMDVGSGFGVDSITFAQHGAKLTFVDLVETNLKVLERLCNILGLQATRFHLLKDVDSIKALDTDYDVIMAMGSMHNAPAEVMKPEYQELIRHLKIGGRWLQLAYPKARWIRDGSPSFEDWGPMVDGPGTPWEEWYDVPKLLSMFEPAKFDVVLYREFHNNDFNWFDLLYRGI